jgi:hypothetical protein
MVAAKKSATKPAAKKSAKKPAVKITAAKPAAKKIRYGRTLPGKPVHGFEKIGDIFVPIGRQPTAVIPASKLSAGLAASQTQIKKSLQELASVFTQDFVVSEIQLAMSFSAEGKFLGFGAGGAMSVKVTIRPIEDDG